MFDLTKLLLEKSFSRTFSVILFALYSILLIQPFKWSLPFMGSIILLLNLAIILGATCFGSRGVIAFGGMALVVAFLGRMHLDRFIVTFPLLVVATTAICYSFSLKVGRLNTKLETELETIEEEANVLSVELEHLRLENSAFRQKLQRYTTLKSLTERLSASLTLDDALSLITSESFRIIGKSDVCLLYLLDREKQELHLAASTAKDPDYEIKLKKGDIFDNWVFKQRTRLMIMDTKKDFRFNLQDVQGLENRNVRSLIAAPLISQNKLQGILRLDNVSPDSYDAGDLRLLDIISDLAGLAIENTQFYQKTEKLAITDGLTGLFVHRHFQERFEQEISRAVWTKSGFAFLMLDIDNFKSYNDRYGHIAGDIVLKQIARLISAGVNPGDIVARYGGEEFAVLLVDTSEEEAAKTAEGIRRSIEEEKFVLRRETTDVRISGGLAFFPADGREREELIQRADRALYKAKSEGKNRICRL